MLISNNSLKNLTSFFQSSRLRMFFLSFSRIEKICYFEFGKIGFEVKFLESFWVLLVLCADGSDNTFKDSRIENDGII